MALAADETEVSISLAFDRFLQTLRTHHSRPAVFVQRESLRDLTVCERDSNDCCWRFGLLRSNCVRFGGVLGRLTALGNVTYKP